MSHRLSWYFLSIVVACIASLGLTASSSSAAVSYKMLYSFQGENEINDDDDDGSNGATGLIFDITGNAYGTTVTGGVDDCGTVFELKNLGGGQWSEIVLYSFTCFNDGKNPHGGLAFDKKGNLVGTTVAGGSGGTCTGDGCGVVFELSPTGGEKVLYNFTGGNDGFGPGAPLTVDTGGDIFGMTPDGGAYSAGTVFHMTLRNGVWRYNVIHAFTGGADGAVGSLGPLLIDPATGKMYGVTELGGRHSAGTAFRLARGPGGAWNFNTLYTFKGQPDAAFPYGGLIPDTAGNLYGTTYYGGTSGVGTVYELSPKRGTWTEQVLYNFKGGTDGSLPTTTLVFDAAQNLYGTTSTGGRPSCDCGTIFKLKPNPWTESIIHDFGVLPDGSYPYYNLMPGPGGALYGATTYGGVDGFGAIFKIAP
jgi:uncharacterized repeat protein (TIGR03803 family)